MLGRTSSRYKRNCFTAAKVARASVTEPRTLHITSARDRVRHVAADYVRPTYNYVHAMQVAIRKDTSSLCSRRRCGTHPCETPEDRRVADGEAARVPEGAHSRGCTARGIEPRDRMTRQVEHRALHRRLEASEREGRVGRGTDAQVDRTDRG